MIISIWRCESVCFAMQKSRFYRAKPMLLECKTIGFITHWHTICYAKDTVVKNIYTFITAFRLYNKGI